MIIDLQKPNLRTLQVKDIVVSSKGFEFELVKKENNKESWKDLTTGLIWHDIEEGLFNHYKAMETFGNNLPTKEEFEIAEQHGFREILPNMSGYYFWSSSSDSYSPDYAYVLDGDYGGICYYNRDINDGAVRCVARQPTLWFQWLYRLFLPSLQ